MVDIDLDVTHSSHYEYQGSSGKNQHVDFQLGAIICQASRDSCISDGDAKPVH